ncbi:hypothetical protein BGW80DRAFT_1463435 [Lactifluus volemus]|nr:hypothetical protein BGW80DRAFT_1463435 [Lactifluus volemus]
MPRNLANHRVTHLENQPPLLVWNRSKEKSEKLFNELGGGHKVAIAQSVADVATNGDYRSKEVAYTLVPAIGRRVLDLGETVEKVGPHTLTPQHLNKFEGSVGFSIDGGVKDATHMRRLASEQNSPTPIVDTAHNHMLTARALHGTQARTGTTHFPVLDWSSDRDWSV